jgi:PAS domain S-box-containing protein
MKKTSGIRQFRALYSFVLVLVIFLAIAAVIPLVQLRGEILEIATEDAARDLDMLGSLIREAMIRHDYSTIRETVTYWGDENARVLGIKAVSPNGFVFSEFSREASGPYPNPVMVTRQIRHDGRVLATLQLTENFDIFAHESEKVIRRNILSFAVFTVAMGMVLWITLRRTAIIPMRKLFDEVHTLNLTLEERVQTRTADLNRANEDLEQEIGDRIKAEEHLKESEERYRGIVASAADGVLLLDPSVTGGPVIVEANESACRMHGYSQEEMVGMPISSLDDTPSRAKIKERARAMMSGERLSFEINHVRKDKSTFPLEVSAQLVSVKGRSYIISIERDITERKEAEEVLQRARDSLERQNEELRKIDRMKDALLRDVSHELKTPVAKHAMQLEILRPLLGSSRTTEGERRAFSVMQESIRRQESVIRNLLSLARLESGGRQYSREPFRLDKLVEKVLEDYAESIETRGIAVSVVMPEISMSSDIEMLWHVLSNLLSNAIKFQRREGLPKISISARTQNEHVIVKIEDNGIGMSREVQERIFSRFFQATASIEGSGVGLTICKRIVEELGGSIRMESKGIGLGSAVEVTLPMC